MHIMPRGHIETDPCTSSYFVTLSLEYPKGPCLIGILAQVGLFAFRSIPVSKVFWNFGSSLVDGDFEKE